MVCNLHIMFGYLLLFQGIQLFPQNLKKKIRFRRFSDGSSASKDPLAECLSHSTFDKGLYFSVEHGKKRQMLTLGPGLKPLGFAADATN